MWQEFARHGLQTFADEGELRTRINQLDSATGELCDSIAQAASRLDLQGIERAVSLRSKPSGGGKSLYECLNQLIHYWYCCAGGLHLFGLGYVTVQMRPTAEDNVSAEGGAYDLVAFSPSKPTVDAEVFCVSKALWPTKMSKTLKKLESAPSEHLRFIYYNLESKPTYRSKRDGISFYGISSPSTAVTLIYPTLTKAIV
jgi:hypothetical protein